ncbi:MarR family transcriptional regulator [Streptomyces sp. AcH 505]|uniref:MarR family winged helix-turn-helix transcriptional regulator n=1 Tax=unclassified Streptomyces TaxID=2593676 RepID=UPI00059224A9|nr:MarR family transcriptional regulator [Streptomyces sp. NBC_00370]KIF71382.1 MarR family transcriptional regulator [Streptomyces sp. AcH 505]
MSRFTGQSRQREQVAEAACAASELLEVLWGRGQDAAPSGPVSPSQLRALLVIEEHEGANLRTLSEVLGSRPSSLSRLCDRMEAMGLVQRSPSPTSRREVELRLTRRGHVVLDEYRAFRSREVEAVLEQMDPSDIMMLAEGLAAFRAAARSRLGTAQDGPGEAQDEVADSA